MVKALGPSWIGDRGQVGFARPALLEQVAEFVAWLCTDSIAGAEVGLWSERELIRSLTQSGGWDLDSLDAAAPDAMTGELTNAFVIEVPLKGEELGKGRQHV